MIRTVPPIDKVQSTEAFTVPMRWRTDENGHQTREVRAVTVEVTVDIPELLRWMAARVAHNKDGRAEFMGGIVKARALSTEVLHAA